MAQSPQRRREWSKLYRVKNREKIREYARQWYRDHEEKNKEWGRRKFMANPDRHRLEVRRDYLNRTYGKGAAEYYDRQLLKQKGRCAICGKPTINRKFGKLHLDHDTACCRYEYTANGKRKMLRSCGKCRRGLLCNNCNSVLPVIENPQWRKKAVAYVKRWRNRRGASEKCLTQAEFEF